MRSTRIPGVQLRLPALFFDYRPFQKAHPGLSGPVLDKLWNDPSTEIFLIPGNRAWTSAYPRPAVDNNKHARKTKNSGNHVAPTRKFCRIPEFEFRTPEIHIHASRI